MMDATLDYFFFADRFGWPPAVVDELPVVYRQRFGVVAGVVAEVRASKSSRAG